MLGTAVVATNKIVYNKMKHVSMLFTIAIAV